MLSIKSIENIFNNIETTEVASNDMKNYINSLNKEEYASIATIFIIGRSGWERNYYDTNEYYSFIEDNMASGIDINQNILDDKFLSKGTKQKQIKSTYNFELSNSPKVNGRYNHDWLGLKTNLIVNIEKGLNMLREFESKG